MSHTPKLLYGPYVPPQIREGDMLFDERYGLVRTSGYSDGRIPWPRRTKTGRHSLILCGDLVKAVKTESAGALRYYFGVSAGVVWAWRKALKVGRMTEGTREVYREIMPDKLPPDATARGRQQALQPASREKMRRSKLGKPMHPHTKASLLAAISKPKSAKWRQALSESLRAQWRDGRRRRPDQGAKK